jgi:hypothetical protein
MWTCSKCERIFQKVNQPHSCKKVAIEVHFKHKEKAKELFDYLFRKIESNIGKCKVISLPCCIHLFGKYDFLAILPKKDRIEVRFGLSRVLKSKRLKQSVPVTKKYYKNCIDIHKKEEINAELIKWIDEAYNLKEV